MVFCRKKVAFQEGKVEAGSRPKRTNHVEVEQVCWVSVLDASESNVRHATRVVAAAVEADKRLFFLVFLAIQKGR